MATWVYDDGGRKRAGYRGECDDCVVRAIAIATGLPYGDVYKELAVRQNDFAATGRCKQAKAADLSRVFGRGTPRDGVYNKVYGLMLAALGWEWVPTMKIGSGCKVHLRGDELPGGKIICKVSKHLVAVVDGVVHDNHDSTRDGTRCVYGYWRAGKDAR